MVSINPANQIIVALDVPQLAEAIALVERLPQVTFWKVGLELFYGAGTEILEYLNHQNKRIFLDLKLNDIPNTVAAACRVIATYGVEMITIHTSVGRAGLLAAQDALNSLSTPRVKPIPQLIGVTLLTSFSARDLAFDLKVPLELPEYILHLALLAQGCGLAGVVCSPQEAAQIQQVCGDDFVRICPGIRPLGSEQGDQRRSLTPKAALDAGANFLVIGRPITQAPDPAHVFEQICAQCQQ
ncbi:orotidine-5'-phosphate decarboxylase [Candidatus Synechococcus calcipolaris G9]|uniref:Orotidine 5'-phosphate decarboxylase n=1 Tax=Candidatus Synechococcus calcipolaris G9 TaxID=1497997 RepID=A0ABT6EU33_9SYNE|nr:orotidine-5'-phosphate decarboxylase [Candidatus Synechococcus calcipolaris]MDG2989410.1 orotidine-5'-phosphate decarboxylase [Candidatus Synechococcus calcipolaris G9]